MSLLDRLVTWLRPAGRALTLSDILGRYADPIVASGVMVNETTALNCSAYWNGVDVISSQVASLPRIVYRRLPNDVRERAASHPAYRVLHDEPNPLMTSFVFWQTMMAHVLTWGNAYAEIEFDRALRPIALWPITPNRINPIIDGQRLRYQYLPTGDHLEPEDMLHVPGLGFDGIKGYSVVAMARQSLGLGLAAERFGATFFGNGAWPGIVLEHPGRLTQEAQDRLVASVERRHQTADRAHRPMVAEEGMKVAKIGIPPEDAQFLETREFQVEEIARWLNIPPHKLKAKVGERPGGNLEASQIEFLTDCLRPWLVRVEQETSRKLIASSQRGTFYVEHKVDAILRADAASRAASYRAYFDMGVLSADQIAAMENLPLPLPAKPSVRGNGDGRLATAERAVVVEAVARFVRRETEGARRAAKRGAETFGAWVDEFYEKETDVLQGFLLASVGLHMAAIGMDGDAKEVARRLACDYMKRSREDLLGLKTHELEEGVTRLTRGWELTRPLEVADALTVIGKEEARAL